MRKGGRNGKVNDVNNGRKGGRKEGRREGRWLQLALSPFSHLVGQSNASTDLRGQFLPEAKPTGLVEAMSVCLSVCPSVRRSIFTFWWPGLTRCDAL